MIRGFNNIAVNKVFGSNNTIIGNINDYKTVFKRTAVGEQLLNKQPFEFRFPYPVDAKYFCTFYYYPKGQWTRNGNAIDNCCFYLKLVSSESDHVNEILTVDIQFRIYGASNLSDYVSTAKKRSNFILNDSRKNWAGPFTVISEIDHENIEHLVFTCELCHASIRSTNISSSRNFAGLSLPLFEISIKDLADERAEIEYNSIFGSFNHGESDGISVSHRKTDNEQIPVTEIDEGFNEVGYVEKNLVAQGDELTIKERIHFENNPFKPQNMGHVGGSDRMAYNDDLVAQGAITDELTTEKRINFRINPFKPNDVAEGDITNIPKIKERINFWNNPFKPKVSHGNDEINKNDTDVEYITDESKIDKKVNLWDNRDNLFQPNVYMDIEEITDRGANHEMRNDEVGQKVVSDMQTFDEKVFYFNSLFQPNISEDMDTEQVSVGDNDEMSLLELFKRNE